MENKINIAELLKDCPIGMELDCAIFNDVTLYRIDTSSENEYPIRIETKNGNFLDLTKYGTYSNVEESKCVIFPKGKTTWEGFVPPCEFKDGDICYIKTEIFEHIFIFKVNEDYNLIQKYVNLAEKHFYTDERPVCSIDDVKEIRLATEEEKAKLFDAIKANGYKWNAETKTLEKLITPKFKVGNRVKSKINQHKYTIADIKKDGYIIYYYYGSDILEYHVPFCNENDFKLVSDNFDIDTLKPFDKVLARCSTSDKWRIQFFEKYDRTSIYPFICMGYNKYKQCVPYEGNEHLLDTNNNCDEYFKTW